MTENDTQRAEGLILGLAPDIDHVGWAVIDADGHKVLGMGVHRFNPPLDPKSKVSLARKRRSFYYARINKRRTKYRAKAVLTVLRAHGLVPEGAGPEWLQSAKGERPVARLRAALIDALRDRPEGFVADGTLVPGRPISPLLPFVEV